jgi:hypothetical protein
MAFPARSAVPAPVSSPATESRPASPRERLEALLRVRKLDRTLTTSLPERRAHDLAAFGLAALDSELGGGVPRGQVSELVGPLSSGRTSLAWAWLGAATLRGESVALIDTFDRFDPETATRCGLDLSRLLWVRGQAITKTTGAIDPAWLPGTRTVQGPGTLVERTIDRAIKALNLVLQSGVCTVVVLDMADVPLAGLRRVPPTTWLRLQRIIEGTDTACLLMGPVPLARSAGGVAITLGHAAADSAPVERRTLATRGTWATQASPLPGLWRGAHDRARRLGGVPVHARMSSPRWTKQARVQMATTTRANAWAVE